MVVFDIGGVLIGVDFKQPCRGMFECCTDRDDFLSHILGDGYHRERDLGVPMADTADAWSRRFPHLGAQIREYTERVSEIWTGPIPGMQQLLVELNARETQTYGLSNWGHETWPLARARFPIVDQLAGVLISADVGVVKPDRRIYESFCERFDVDPTESVFIDDSWANVNAANALGFYGIHFTNAEDLRAELHQLQLL